MVDNDELFDKYPWGRLSYKMTTDSIKNGLNYIRSNTCNATGFPYALLVWAYQKIPALVGKEYVKKLGNNIPRILTINLMTFLNGQTWQKKSSVPKV